MAVWRPQVAVCTAVLESVSRPGLVRGYHSFITTNRISHFAANEMNVAVLIGLKSWFCPPETVS